MRTRLVWLLAGAAIATVGTVVIPAWANTLSEEKAGDKAKKWAKKEYNRDAEWVNVRRTRASVEGCKRQKVEGSPDQDPHRVACRVRVHYYWERGNGYVGDLPNDLLKCVLMKKNHESGNVKAGLGGGC